MKKYMNMPDVKVVRFENKDVIVTSDPISTYSYEEGEGLVQGRSSIWED